MHFDGLALDPAVLAGEFVCSIGSWAVENPLPLRTKLEFQRHPPALIVVCELLYYLRAVVNGDKPHVYDDSSTLHFTSPPHSPHNLKWFGPFRYKCHKNQGCIAVTMRAATTKLGSESRAFQNALV